MDTCNMIIDNRKVRIHIIDGSVVEGAPIDISYSDDTGRPEDEIDIEQDDGRIVSIPESAIGSFDIVME